MPDERSIEIPESLAGASTEEVIRLIPAWWIKHDTRKGGGKRFANPHRIGEQVRLMPGNPADPIAMKRGPCVVVSKDGSKWRIPLMNNPTIQG